MGNALVDNELQVYLPNALSFVFELLVDRLNVSKSTEFRGNADIWKLFNKTWKLQEHDQKARNRTFQALRFGEAVAVALKALEHNEESIATITETLNLVRLGSTLINSQDSAIQILSGYLQLIDSSKTEQRIRDIVSFFKASVSVENYTPKFITAFVVSVLPGILSVIDSSIAYPLISLIKRTVLYKDNLAHLKDNTDLLLKQQVSDSAIVHFYKLIVNALSKSDIETLELIYTKITQSHPETSESMLEYISQTKRTLSQSFLLDVFETEFSKKQQNWSVIQSVLELDIEVGIKHAEKIMKCLEEQDSTNYIAIGKEVIDAHVRARELETFFKLWTTLLKNSSTKWGTLEFRKMVSQSITTLSSTQLKSLIEMLLADESSSKYEVLSTVIQGLFTIKNKIVLRDVKQILKSVFNLAEDIDIIWTMRYQLLCLYEDILPQIELETLCKQDVNKPSIHKFYTLFRIREMFQFDTTPVIKQFMNFVKSNHDSKTLNMIFQRWFVLINQLFHREDVDKLVSYLLQDEPLTLQVLGNHHLFEQTNMVESLITIITDAVKKRSVSQFHLTILQNIPIQCYPRRVKVPLLDSLTKKYLKLNSEGELYLQTIIHILQTPTFKSQVESDIETISKIVEREPQSLLFETVWIQRISNFKEEQSLKFAQECIDFVSKGLKKSKDFSNSMYMCFTILSSPSSSLDVSLLQHQFIEFSKTLLSSYLKKSPANNINNTSWLFRVLYTLDLQQNDFNKLYPSLLSFAQSIQSSEYSDTKASLFLLLAKYKKETSSVEFFESLYIVLRQQGVSKEKVMDGLSSILSSLDDEQFNEGLVSAIASVIPTGQLPFILEIITCYLSSLRRSNIRAQELLVKCLSIIATNLHSLDTQSLLIVVQSLKALLVEKSWIIAQYGLELIITLITRIIDQLDLGDQNAEECYISVSLCMSSILLHQRYRLSNRHHIILALFTSLMKSLTKKRSSVSTLQGSRSAAESYSRLLNNLCEPPQMKESQSDSLNSATQMLKKALRRHLHVLLLTYINCSLKYSFEPEIREVLLPGIFGIFDVLSDNELLLVSTSLDYSGRVYYRTLYDDYKKMGKWKTD